MTVYDPRMIGLIEMSRDVSRGTKGGARVWSKRRQRPRPRAKRGFPNLEDVSEVALPKIRNGRVLVPSIVRYA